MADTVAVMNAGVIEAIGDPVQALREPLLDVRGELPGPVEPDPGHGAGACLRRRHRRHARGRGLHLCRTARTRRVTGAGSGSGPRRSLIGDLGEALDAPGNTILGVVSDVSFVGVSTQYLVRMPWGQELQVFSQNTGRTRSLRGLRRLRSTSSPGRLGVRLPPRCCPGRLRRRPASGRRWPTRCADRGRQLTLADPLPAAVWLGIFFVIPFYSLVATSLFDPSGSDSKGYEMTYHFANDCRDAPGRLEPLSSACWCTARSQPESAWYSATCWRTRSHSRPAAGRT